MMKKWNRLLTDVRPYSPSGSSILVFFIASVNNSSSRPESYGASPALSCAALLLQIATAVIMNLDILINQVRTIRICN